MNPLLSFIRRKILRLPADRWNYQYAAGQWDGLEAEHARLDAVVGFIARYAKPHPDILEIGCGKAVMLQRMPADSFHSFLGIDLSEVAITAAKFWENDRAKFAVADMSDFVPPGQYDVIAFNESLYYAKAPVDVFQRYIPYLNPDGHIVVSAYQNKYTAHLWPALDSQWQAIDSTEVRVQDAVWEIRVYQPLQAG